MTTRMIRRVLPGMAAVLALLLMLGWFRSGLETLERAGRDEGRRQLEEALRRAAVACYAAEGVYPDSLEGLCVRTGIRIREDAYTVYYDVFAENLMPDITVLENRR